MRGSSGLVSVEYGVHNTFLMVLGEAGIFSFLIIVFIYLLLLIKSLKCFSMHQEYTYLTIAIVGYLMVAHNYFDKYDVLFVSIWLYNHLNNSLELESEKKKNNMCGIYGTNKSYSNEQIKSNLKRINFRGPDYCGIQSFGTNNQITFGHNRLSIIDLDPRSNQPFSYHSKIHIVFNGEIYNFLNLKSDLSKKGYAFKTTSDTEVLCAAYIEYGKDFVNKLNGMFAFVIYDESKNIIFAARDRMGQKPFYYSFNDGQFEFSSQISAIQQFNSNLTISNKAIDYFLTWSFIPDPYSIFNEIKKLKAGYSLEIDLNTNTISTNQYWDINSNPINDYKKSYNDAKVELNELLEDAISKRLIADVPIGVFLSGGVDSSLVAALAVKSSTEKVKTFSVKFNEKGFDESIYAQKVANHLGTDHHVIECNYNEGLELIEILAITMTNPLLMLLQFHPCY